MSTFPAFLACGAQYVTSLHQSDSLPLDIDSKPEAQEGGHQEWLQGDAAVCLHEDPPPGGNTLVWDAPSRAQC